MMHTVGTNGITSRQVAHEVNVVLEIAARMGHAIDAHQQLALDRGDAESTSFERTAHTRFCSMCFQLCLH